MASMEFTDGKRQEASAGAKFSRIYRKGFSQIYDAVKKEFSEQGVFEVTQAQLWSCITAEWQESYGELNDHEIELLSVLFRLWILEKHWILGDEIHTSSAVRGGYCEFASVVGKAIRDGICEFPFTDTMDPQGAKTEAVNIEAGEQNVIETDGNLESQGYDKEMQKKVYHEIVEAVDGKPYLLEYCTFEEKRQRIDEIERNL